MGTLGLIVMSRLVGSCDSSAPKKPEPRRVVAQQDNLDDSEPGSSSQASGEIKSSKSTKSAEFGGEESTPPIVPQAPTNEETKKDSEKAAATTDFGGWCTKVLETKPFSSGRLKPLLGDFCDGPTAKPLLKETLIASAYVGSGDPKFTDILPLSSNAATRTTSYRFGVAIKLPLSLKDHFDRAAPKMGDMAEIKKLQESTGAVATVTVSAPILADGPFHTQGWSVKSTAIKQVLVQSVTSEATTRSDLFKLVDAKQYLYSQYTDKAFPVKTIKNFDYIGAGITVENNSYIIAVVDISMDNLGFSSVAENEVKTLAINGIKQIYTQAELAK